MYFARFEFTWKLHALTPRDLLMRSWLRGYIPTNDTCSGYTDIPTVKAVWVEGSLVPRPSNRGGKAWYTLFAHVLNFPQNLGK